MDDQWMRVIYLLAWLALIAGGWRVRRLDASKAVKYGVIWLAIIVTLALFYNLMRQWK